MWLDVKEAASHIKSSRRYLDELRSEGDGPKCYFVANKWVYKQSDLDDWIESKKPMKKNGGQK